jgi:ribosome-binding protein aMBF1 (putative translation factor)
MSPKIQDILDTALEQVRAALLEEASQAVRLALSGGQEVGNGRRTATPEAASKAMPSKPTKLAKRPKGAKRTPEEIEALVKSVDAAIKGAKTGIRSEQLGAQLGVSTADLVLPLQRLLSEKKVKTKGVRRGMQYLPK